MKPSDFAALHKENVETAVFFKRTRVVLCEKEEIFEDSASSFTKTRFIENFTIFSNQINRSDPSNLLAWAQVLDNLSRNHKVF